MDILKQFRFLIDVPAGKLYMRPIKGIFLPGKPIPDGNKKKTPEGKETPKSEKK